MIKQLNEKKEIDTKELLKQNELLKKQQKALDLTVKKATKK